MDSEPTPFTENRPWGWFRRFTDNDQTTVKVIHVAEGEEFSLQHHEHRSEFWRVISGTPRVTIGEKVVKAKPGDEFFITPKTKHRLHAEGTDTEFLEISFGEFDENDIVRFEDKYGRK